MNPAITVVLVSVAACALAAAALAVLIIIRRNAHMWLPAYVRGAADRRRRRAARSGVTHVLFAFVDHFEPVVKRDQDPALKRDAMADWVRRYPQLAARHRDSDGRPPRHTWTYPLETYRPDYLDQLVALARAGLGEVEVHIHHDADTAESFRARMLDGLKSFARHGVSVIPGVDGFRFAFVHGDWALDNSDPQGRRCGVNNELIILRELGCFADFTLPSAPAGAQTRKINSIYYATDDPERPKSHDTGTDVQVGKPPTGDLLIIQGPLLLDWSSRKFGIVPRIDNAAVTGPYPARPQRVDAWVRLGIGVVGRPDWVFIKVHCHGAHCADREALLGRGADELFTHLETAYASGAYRLHYVTAREMFNLAKAAEAGKTGDPGAWLDFVVPPYACQQSGR